MDLDNGSLPSLYLQLIVPPPNFDNSIFAFYNWLTHHPTYPINIQRDCSNLKFIQRMFSNVFILFKADESFDLYSCVLVYFMLMCFFSGVWLTV